MINQKNIAKKFVEISNSDNACFCLSMAMETGTKNMKEILPIKKIVK